MHHILSRVRRYRRQYTAVVCGDGPQRSFSPNHIPLTNINQFCTQTSRFCFSWATIAKQRTTKQNKRGYVFTSYIYKGGEDKPITAHQNFGSIGRVEFCFFALFEEKKKRNVNVVLSSASLSRCTSSPMLLLRRVYRRGRNRVGPNKPTAANERLNLALARQGFAWVPPAAPLVLCSEEEYHRTLKT